MCAKETCLDFVFADCGQIVWNQDYQRYRYLPKKSLSLLMALATYSGT